MKKWVVDRISQSAIEPDIEDRIIYFEDKGYELVFGDHKIMYFKKKTSDEQKKSKDNKGK